MFKSKALGGQLPEISTETHTLRNPIEILIYMVLGLFKSMQVLGGIELGL